MALNHTVNTYIRAVTSPSYMVIVRKEVRPTFYFYMNESKERNGQYHIFGRLTIARKKSEFATGIMVKRMEWDQENKQLKNKSKNMDAHKIMIQMESEIFKIIKHREANGLPISSKIIKDIFQNKLDKDSSSGATFTLLQYIDVFISYAEKNKSDYTDATVQHYRTVKKHIIAYLKSIGLTDIPLHMVDSAFLQKLDDFLMTWIHPKLNHAMNRNTANKYMSMLRSVLHRARREKLISLNPFENFKLKHYKPKSTNLINQEITQIVQKNLNSDRLELARDYLILSIFMGGMRFSDLSTLSIKKIFQEDGHYFVYLDFQEKTESSVHTPLLAPAVAILKKYSKEQEDTGFVLPKLSHQKVNEYLKSLGDVCGINKSLTHKIARHSFATTICGRNGIPRHITSAWIGHVQKDTPTDTYAQITREEALKYLKILWSLYSKDEFLPKTINR